MRYLILVVVILISIVPSYIFCGENEQEGGNVLKSVIKLPPPRLKSEVSLEEAIFKRRSHRSFTKQSLELSDISQIMWAAQGSTDPRGFRTAPSAGALYPLEVYIVAGSVNKLKSGVYKYNTRNHELVSISEKDIRSEIAHAALEQDFIRDVPLIIIICAIYERVTGKYGSRGIRYADMEAGHVAQNILLQVTALNNLGTVTIGAFEDEKVAELVGLSKNEKPLYIMPVGAIGN